MTISQSVSDSLCQKLRMVGLTKGETLPLVNALTKQIAAEGPENVVKRLKVLKQAAVNHIAGKPVVFDWITNTGSAPKGVWKPIWLHLQSASYRQKFKAFNAIMVYASVVLPTRDKPTKAQERKFLSSVVQEIDQRNLSISCKSFSRDRQYIAALGELRKLSIPSRRLLEEDPPLTIEYGAQKYGSNDKGVTKTEGAMLRILGTDWGREYHPFPEIQKTLGLYGESYFELTHPWNNSYGRWDQSQIPTEPVGVIGSSQEPGLKFRAFAAPNIVLQAALQPLKAFLLATLKDVPWDYTHDQDRGVLQVQKWIREGSTIHSVDLSDATNNFPLELQLHTLRALGVSDSTVRLIEMVCKSPYELMWNKGQVVSWTKGQPLGAGPSFMMFALTHGALVRAIELKLGVSDTFCILGDDFICKNDLVHQAYRKALKQLSCPISESKCLSSPLAGEFAGKLILADHVFHGFKYKEISDLSFMSVVKTLGPHSISRSFLTDSQYKLAQVLRTVPEPYGLGFNPKGIPYVTRMEQYLFLMEELERLKKPVVKVHKENIRMAFEYRVKHPQMIRAATYNHGVSLKEERLFQGYLRATAAKRNSSLPIPKRIEEVIVNDQQPSIALHSETSGDPRKNIFSDLPVTAAVRIHSSILERYKEIVPTESPEQRKIREYNEQRLASFKSYPDQRGDYDDSDSFSM